MIYQFCASKAIMTSLLNGDKTLYMTKNWWNTVYDKRYVRSDFEKKEKKNGKMKIRGSVLRNTISTK